MVSLNTEQSTPTVKQPPSLAEWLALLPINTPASIFRNPNSLAGFPVTVTYPTEDRLQPLLGNKATYRIADYSGPPALSTESSQYAATSGDSCSTQPHGRASWHLMRISAIESSQFKIYNVRLIWFLTLLRPSFRGHESDHCCRGSLLEWRQRAHLIIITSNYEASNRVLVNIDIAAQHREIAAISLIQCSFGNYYRIARLSQESE